MTEERWIAGAYGSGGGGLTRGDCWDCTICVADAEAGLRFMLVAFPAL